MPNSPYLDKSVQWRIRTGHIDFQEPGYQSTVQAILSAGLATEVEMLIGGGKEADVYLVRYNGAPLIVKTYRLYRTSHRGGRAIKVDTMAWMAAREYEMLHRAWKGGVRVPTPARRVENMLAMRYLGDHDGPAPRLSDIHPENPPRMLEQVLDTVEALARVGIIHGDLSAYNLLIHGGDPWLIDFSQAFRSRQTGSVHWWRLEPAKAALSQGLTSLNAYFRRYGLTFSIEPMVSHLVAEWARAGPAGT